MSENEKNTVRGVLIPEDWDESNRIIKMAICAKNGQEYLIEMNSLGKELTAHKGAKAILNGSLADSNGKRKTIVIDSYEIEPW